jgi:hypothetical protein
MRSQGSDLECGDAKKFVDRCSGLKAGIGNASEVGIKKEKRLIRY